MGWFRSFIIPLSSYHYTQLVTSKSAPSTSWSAHEQDTEGRSGNTEGTGNHARSKSPRLPVTVSVIWTAPPAGSQTSRQPGMKRTHPKHLQEGRAASRTIEIQNKSIMARGVVTKPKLSRPSLVSTTPAITVENTWLVSQTFHVPR